MKCKGGGDLLEFYDRMQKISSLLITLLCLSAAHGRAKEVIQVGIGTQDTTINCAAGGPVVRELKLLDKYLPHDGKYKDATYEIHWVNLPTGAQLNNELLAGRLDIVSMADFPSILGYDALLSKNDGVRTLYIASLSLGIHGAAVHAEPFCDIDRPLRFAIRHPDCSDRQPGTGRSFRSGS